MKLTFKIKLECPQQDQMSSFCRVLTVFHDPKTYILQMYSCIYYLGTMLPPITSAYKRKYEDEEEEYDSEMDDFIDDGGDQQDEISQHIKEIFGYDRNKLVLSPLILVTRHFTVWLTKF